MKNLLYVFCLAVATIGLDGCKKDDPVPVPEVVGTWETDRIRVSGLPAPYTASNREYDAYDFAGIRNSFEVKVDKTFTGTDRSDGLVDDYSGTWDYSGTELTLKFDDGNEQALTYDASRLVTENFAQQDTVRNSTTQQIEVILRYNIQLVYSKQQ